MNELSGFLRRGRGAVAVAGIGAALLLAACGSSSESSGGTASTSAPAASTGASTTAAAGKPVRIAYLSFAVANSYDAPMLAAAKAAAADANAEITVLDANNDPKAQFAQLQNATASGDYDAIIVQPIFGTGLVKGVEAAIAKGIKVVNLDQVLGPDLSSNQPQVKGLSATVSFVPTEIGRKLGELVVQACQSRGLNPCKVGYLYDIKASALDVAINKAFQQAIKGHGIQVVAQGESFFTPAKGLAATQDMLAAHSDLNLIVGSDQGIEGAVQAVGDKKVILVGYGASAAAIQGVSSGAWYGDVAQLPATEGRLAVQAAVKAVRDGTDSGGVDPVGDLPNAGVITKDNVKQFTAEWPG